MGVGSVAVAIEKERLKEQSSQDGGVLRATHDPLFSNHPNPSHHQLLPGLL